MTRRGRFSDFASPRESVTRWRGGFLGGTVVPLENKSPVEPIASLTRPWLVHRLTIKGRPHVEGAFAPANSVLHRFPSPFAPGPQLDRASSMSVAAGRTWGLMLHAWRISSFCLLRCVHAMLLLERLFFLVVRLSVPHVLMQADLILPRPEHPEHA